MDAGSNGDGPASTTGCDGPCPPPDLSIIPADRRTHWNPGLNAVGGIPSRKTIYKTLSPNGGDDTSAIQKALDTCPPDQVVQLTAGTFNIRGDGLHFATSGCTLRGAGTGAPGSGNGGTRLVKADRATNPNFAVLYMGGDANDFQPSIDLANDGVKESTTITLVSNPGIKAGEFLLVDEVTWDPKDPQGGLDHTWWGPNHDTGASGGSRRWFCRQDRSLSQVVEVTAVNGDVLTLSAPLHWTFKTAQRAQVTRYTTPFTVRAGLEDLYVYGGMGGDYHGNVSMNACAYCWIKNIEAHWSVGTSVGMYGTFRSVLRDSYIHETPDPNPGGAGYLVGLAYGAADNLVENNIMWYGNKVIVMRATGGGNVIAYNFTDDAFGSYYPSLGEAGINAGHYTTPHMELLEGNASQNFKGDAFWGSSIYITVFRNHLTGVRGGYGPLATYTFKDDQGHVFPYADLHGRTAVDIQDHSYAQNLVGNVLGLQNQSLLKWGNPENIQQSMFVYEAFNETPDEVVTMWRAGENQTDHNGQTAPWNPQFATTDALLREGNFDWATKSQRWHGVGGQGSGSGAPKPIPDSFYLTQKPDFFGASAFPWVDPKTGSVAALPAKARFEAMPGHAPHPPTSQ